MQKKIQLFKNNYLTLSFILLIQINSIGECSFKKSDISQWIMWTHGVCECEEKSIAKFVNSECVNSECCISMISADVLVV